MKMKTKQNKSNLCSSLVEQTKKDYLQFSPFLQTTHRNKQIKIVCSINDELCSIRKKQTNEKTEAHFGGCWLL